MKNDMEYSAVQEYMPLPDEYLQGGGNALTEKKGGKTVWKKMMYMTAALAVTAYTAVGAFASSDTPVPPQTDNPPFVTEKPDNPQEPDKPENQPEKINSLKKRKISRRINSPQTRNSLWKH